MKVASKREQKQCLHWLCRAWATSWGRSPNNRWIYIGGWTCRSPRYRPSNQFNSGPWIFLLRLGIINAGHFDRLSDRIASALAAQETRQAQGPNWGWGDSMKRHRDWAEIHFCVWRALRKCVKKRSGHRIFSEEKQKCREERRLWMNRRNEEAAVRALFPFGQQHVDKLRDRKKATNDLWPLTCDLWRWVV